MNYQGMVYILFLGRPKGSYSRELCGYPKRFSSLVEEENRKGYLKVLKVKRVL